MSKMDKELKEKILEGRTEQDKLGLKAHWALTELAKFFESRGDNRFYSVNMLQRELERIYQHNDVS